MSGPQGCELPWTGVTKLRSDMWQSQTFSRLLRDFIASLGLLRIQGKGKGKNVKIVSLQPWIHRGEWRHSSTYSHLRPPPQCWSGRFLKTENFLLLRDSNSGPPSPWLVLSAGKLTMPYRINGHRRFDWPQYLHFQGRQSTAGPNYTHSPASQNTWIFRRFVTAKERVRPRKTAWLLAVDTVALDRPTVGVRAIDAA